MGHAWGGAAHFFRNRARRLAIVAGAAAGLALLGCGYFLGLDSDKDRVPGDDGGNVSESGDVAAVDGGPDGSACPLATPPPPPAQSDPSDADITVFGVIRTVDLGERLDGGPPPPLYGYDIDSVATCCDASPSSCEPHTGANLPAICDEEGGRDNSGGKMLQKLGSFANGLLDQDTLNAGINAGIYTIAISISRYNGQANDTSVTLSAFTSDGVALDADGGRPPPRWDGTDQWTIDTGSVLSVDDAGHPIPLQYDMNAYVSNWTLVSSINFPLAFGSGNGTGTRIVLNGALVSGRLVPEKGSFRIDDGQGTGRIKLTNLFDLLHNITFNGLYLCPGNMTYEFGKNIICSYADIATDQTLDNTGAPCDAISLSVGFTAYPAQFGSINDGGVPLSPCVDAAPYVCP